MSVELELNPITPIPMTVSAGSETAMSAEEMTIARGISPTVEMEPVAGGTQLTITDLDGAHTATILNGVDGQDGQDGVDGKDGADGKDGKDGKDGLDGQDGQDGADGTNAYVYIRYAAAMPEQDSDMKTTPDAWIGIYGGDAATAPTTYTSYTWYKIKGEDGQDGQDGADGAPGQDGKDGKDGLDGQDGQDGTDGTNAYVHIKYASSQPSQDSDMKDTADAWMGIYSGESETAPTTYTSYTWYNIKGSTGNNGYNVYIKYAAQRPTKNSDMGTTPDAWMGVATGTVAPTSYTAYLWYKIKGEDGEDGADGQDGTDGTDGTNAYVHIKYASSQPTQDSDMSDTAGPWMGIYSGSSATAPTTYTSYTWYNIKGATGSAGSDGYNIYIRYASVQPTKNSDMKTTPDAWIGIGRTKSSSAPTQYTSYTWNKIKGETGADGQQGQTGPAGPGVPDGGTAGQILTKASSTDYDTEWTDFVTTASVSNSVSFSLDASTSYLIFAVSGNTSHHGLWIAIGFENTQVYEIEAGAAISYSTGAYSVTFTHSSIRTTRYTCVRLGKFGS